MKKIIAIAVAVVMVFSIATISFAEQGIVKPVPCDLGKLIPCGDKVIKPLCTLNPDKTPCPTKDPSWTPMPKPTMCPKPTPPNSGTIGQTPMPRPTCPPRPTKDPSATSRPIVTPDSADFTIFTGTTTAGAFVAIMDGKKVLKLGRAVKDGTYSVKVLTARIKGVATVETYKMVKGIHRHVKRFNCKRTILRPDPKPTPTPLPNSGSTPTPAPASEPTPESVLDPVVLSQ